VATFVLAGAAHSQARADLKPSFHPTRTVTIVVPYSPGGGTDAVGRLVAKELEAMWGQTVIIPHRRQ
jgi:tripartite-type tricarboxylate transporter receptor subunit TctC